MSLRGQHLEYCECPECGRRRFLLLIDPDEAPLSHHDQCNCITCRESNLRSNKPKTIEISVVKDRGNLPSYLALFHRHFEKANPTVATPEGTLTAPMDQLELLLPADLLTDIEEVTITYQKGT